MTTLRSFSDPLQASVVESFLRDSGLSPAVLDEGASAWTAGRILVPVRLAVPDEEVEKATALLKQFDDSLPADSSE